MKLKKLLNCIIPIAACSIAIPTVVACSNEGGEDDPVEEGKFDIVHSDGSIDHYDTIEKAIVEVKNNETLELHDNVTLSDALILKNLTNVTLDGCGHTIILNDPTIPSIVHLENCYKTTLKDLSICGTTRYDALTASNCQVNLNSVTILANCEDAVIDSNLTSWNIDSCHIESTCLNKTTHSCLHSQFGNDEESVFSISNSFLDNLWILPHGSVKAKIVLGKNVQIRYVCVSEAITKDNLNIVFEGLSNVKGLLFVGYEHLLNGKLSYFTSLTAEMKNELAYYIVNADGLEEFNKLYTTTTETRPVELHLMEDINYSNKIWTPIFTTNQDTEVSISYWANIVLFDGHNHTISYLYIDQDWDLNTIGFFASVGNTTTQNVTFDSCHLEDKDNQNAGMIYGYVVGKAAILNTTVSHSYIGANKKAATFVGVVDSRTENTEPEAYDKMACVKFSNCTSYECKIINKAEAGDVDVYLGGLVAWVRYHDGNQYKGYLDIDKDPNNKIYITNIHFNWQQEVVDWTTGFEIANIFLYDHYRQCNAYNNVVVHYEGE